MFDYEDSTSKCLKYSSVNLRGNGYMYTSRFFCQFLFGTQLLGFTIGFLVKTRATHAGANARQQLLLENSKSKKRHNHVKKIRGLPPLLVWVSLLIVKNCKEFQVNISSNDRDIIKCQICFDTMTPAPPPTTGL